MFKILILIFLICLNSYALEKKNIKEIINDYERAIKNQPQNPNISFQLANLYHEIKEHERSIELYKKSIYLYKQQNNIKMLLKSYKYISDSLRTIKDYKSSKKFFSDYVELLEPSIIPNLEGIYDYQGITKYFLEINAYKEALKYAKKSLKLEIKILGESDHRVKESIYNISYLYFKNNNLEKALEQLNRYVKLSKELLNSKNIKQLSKVASTYETLNENLISIDYYKKILKSFYEDKSISNKKDIQILENKIGNLYLKINDFENAILFFEKGTQENKSSEYKITSFINLASIYIYLEEFIKARKNIDKALNLYSKLEKKSEEKYIAILWESARLQGELDNYSDAIKEMKKLIPYFESKSNIKLAKLYTNIGVFYHRLNENIKANEYLEKANVYFHKFIKEKDSLELAILYDHLSNNYRNLYIKTNKKEYFNKAVEYLKKSLGIRINKFGKSHPTLAINYLNIGLFYEFTGEFDKSLEFYLKIEKIYKGIYSNTHNSRIKLYNNISYVYKKKQDYSNAYLYAKKSFDIFLKNRDKNFVILDSKQKQLYVESNSNKLENLLSSASLYIKELESKKDYKQIEKIKEETLNNWLNYKGAIFDSENNMAILYEKSNDKNIKKKIEDLNSYKQQLSKLYQTIPKKSQREIYKTRIEKLEKDISKIEIYLSSKLNEYKEELGLRNINFKDISKKLKDNEIYIDFAKTKDNYFVFTLDNKNSITFEKIDKKTTSNINKNIKHFRENIDKILKSTNLTKTKLNSLNIEAKTILSNLYTDIINKLSNSVSNIKTKDTLIFSLDGVLNFLPLEALYDKTTNKYLIEKKNIQYVPSGKEFVRLLNKKDSKSNNDITMFTNPDYGLNLKPSKTKETLYTPNTRANTFLYKSLFSMIFKPLPGTKEEAKLISTLYPNTKDYNQEEATSTNLFQVNSPKILHISTHGFFLDDKNIKNPMLKAGLAFTGANMARVKGDSQGIVTGLKLAGLNLQNTDLVVLSACETGLGDVNEAEGVSGLNKAFIKAGAKNIVMSLWSVADKETAELMKSFYTNIKKSNNYQKSLKESKIEMIKQNLHPFFWSAFILNGV